MRHPTHESQGERRPIPGPRGKALWRFLLHFREAPPHHLLALALEYGDIVELAFPGERVILLAKPEYIEHVLHHRHHKYDKQTARWQTVRQVWGAGLLTADGDAWRRQRQRMQPAFHQEAVQRFAGMVVEEARKIAAAWAVAAESGAVRDVYEDMLACAVCAIARASFGADVEGKTEIITRALHDVHEYINPMAPLNLLRVPPAVQRLVNPEYYRFRRAYRQIHRMFDDIVTRRLGAPPDQTDLLGMMMSARDDETSEAMSAAQLHDEMMGMLMAGHETTAIATAWCWYWLSQYPQVERKFHAELDSVLGGRLPTYDDLGRLPYTKMVLHEALRITPPTWALDRRAREDDEIDGYLVPKGAKVAFSTFVMHHHPKYWNDPVTFDPDRFSEAHASERATYAYFPFGGGPRRCIGMRFALLEGQLILAVLGQSFSARLKPGHTVEPVARVTLAPRDGVRMLIAQRFAPAPACG